MCIRVLLVDDHKMVRDGLRALLGGAPDIEVVGDVRDGRAALDLMRSLAPNVVVMDVGMPELNGVETTRRIRSEHQGVNVIALSAHAEERFVQRMLDAGACGYVVKAAAHDELLRAVRAASEGGTFLSPEIAEACLSRSPQAEHGCSAYSVLGAREREVLQLVAEGRTSAETAAQMHISIHTVETHRRNIAQKLGLHRTAELTKYAVREGLTSLDL